MAFRLPPTPAMPRFAEESMLLATEPIFDVDMSFDEDWLVGPSTPVAGPSRSDRAPTRREDMETLGTMLSEDRTEDRDLAGDGSRGVFTPKGLKLKSPSRPNRMQADSTVSPQNSPAEPISDSTLLPHSTHTSSTLTSNTSSTSTVTSKRLDHRSTLLMAPKISDASTSNKIRPNAKSRPILGEKIENTPSSWSGENPFPGDAASQGKETDQSASKSIPAPTQKKSALSRYISKAAQDRPVAKKAAVPSKPTPSILPPVASSSKSTTSASTSAAASTSTSTSASLSALASGSTPSLPVKSVNRQISTSTRVSTSTRATVSTQAPKVDSSESRVIPPNSSRVPISKRPEAPTHPVQGLPPARAAHTADSKRVSHESLPESPVGSIWDLVTEAVAAEASDVSDVSAREVDSEAKVGCSELSLIREVEEPEPEDHIMEEKQDEELVAEEGGVEARQARSFAEAEHRSNSPRMEEHGPERNEEDAMPKLDAYEVEIQRAKVMNRRPDEPYIHRGDRPMDEDIEDGSDEPEIEPEADESNEIEEMTSAPQTTLTPPSTPPWQARRSASLELKSRPTEIQSITPSGSTVAAARPILEPHVVPTAQEDHTTSDMADTSMDAEEPKGKKRRRESLLEKVTGFLRRSTSRLSLRGDEAQSPSGEQAEVVDGAQTEKRDGGTEPSGMSAAPENGQEAQVGRDERSPPRKAAKSVSTTTAPSRKPPIPGYIPLTRPVQARPPPAARPAPSTRPVAPSARPAASARSTTTSQQLSSRPHPYQSAKPARPLQPSRTLGSATTNARLPTTSSQAMSKPAAPARKPPIPVTRPAATSAFATAALARLPPPGKGSTAAAKPIRVKTPERARDLANRRKIFEGAATTTSSTLTAPTASSLAARSIIPARSHTTLNKKPMEITKTIPLRGHTPGKASRLRAEQREEFDLALKGRNDERERARREREREREEEEEREYLRRRKETVIWAKGVPDMYKGKGRGGGAVMEGQV